jgi:hypothetical protein
LASVWRNTSKTDDASFNLNETDMQEPSKTKENRSTLLAHLVNTKEGQDLYSGILNGIMDSWAGEQPLKRKFSRFISNLIVKKESQKQPDLASLFNDSGFMDECNQQIPGLLEEAFKLFGIYLQQLSSQPPEKQQQVIQELCRSLSNPEAASISNSLSEIIKSIRNHHPGFFSKQIESLFSSWYSRTDFGEIKETVSLLKPEVSSAVSALNDVIWQYPAKLVILLGFSPDLFNLFTDGLRETLHRFNQAPPDLITDIVCSLLKEIEPDKTASLVNEVSELINKTLTGSALIGEPGFPVLQKSIPGLIEAVLKNMDQELLAKSRLALAREKSILSGIMMEQSAEDPTRLIRNTTFRTALQQLKIQTLNNKLSALEELSDPEFSKMLASLTGSLDTQEISDLVESMLRLLERVQETSPNQISLFTKQIVQQLNACQIQEGFKNLGNIFGKQFQPLQRAVVPDLVIKVCDILSPRDDEFEERATEARQAFRSLFNRLEETS